MAACSASALALDTSAREASTPRAVTCVSNSCGCEIVPGCVDGSLGSAESGLLLITCLRAHDALIGQCDGAAGIGLLMLVLRLGLIERGLRSLHLCLGADGCALGFAGVLPLRLFRLAELPSLAYCGGFRCIERGLQIFAFNGGDELSSFDRLAFLHGQ